MTLVGVSSYERAVLSAANDLSLERRDLIFLLRILYRGRSLPREVVSQRRKDLSISLDVLDAENGKRAGEVGRLFASERVGRVYARGAPDGDE